MSPRALDTVAAPPLFHALPDPSLLLDADGEVVLMNDAARRRGAPTRDATARRELARRAMRSTNPIPGRIGWLGRGDARRGPGAAAGAAGPKGTTAADAPTRGDPDIVAMRCLAVRIPEASPPRVLVRIATDEFGLRQSPFTRLTRQYHEMQRALYARLDAVERERLLEARLFERQKLESLGLLAGGIAHDFNNLLMAVLGHANLALLDLPAGSPARESVRQIEQSARHASSLTRQLLAYAGRGRFVIETLDLSALVRDMLDLLDVALSKRAVLKSALPEGLPAVRGDAAQLRQVILNLVTNAADAIGERSGFVTVATGAVRADAEYLAQLALGDALAPGTYVTLEVRDTGEGMDEERQARIFDPFFTTKPNGHGLGLSAVLGIVRRHGGAIRIYSAPGRGTTFRLLFPECAEPAAARPGDGGAATDRIASLRAAPSRHVLLADDDETVRAVLARAFERVGWTVTAVGNGTDATQLFAEDPDRYDLLVLDMMMPGRTGDDVFAEVARRRPSARVVLMSGYSETEVLERVSGRRLAGYLHKPFSLEDLYALLERVALEEGRNRGPRRSDGA